MVNFNGNALLLKSLIHFSTDSGNVVCDFPTVDIAFLLNTFDNVNFSFFNILISHVVLVEDGKSYWQCIALLIFHIPFQRF